MFISFYRYFIYKTSTIYSYLNCYSIYFYLLPFGKDTMREKVIEIKKGFPPILLYILTLSYLVFVGVLEPINKR